MLRFRPDVVHIASPATLGLQAARAAEELGIPSVAIYQTDLIGFAERYAKPGLGAGGIRAMAYLTRKIHTLVDRTLAPSTASMRQLEELEVPRLALWPRGVDLEAFHPGLRDEGLRRQLAPDGRLLVGYVGRLAPEKELELLTYLSGDPRYALVVVGGGPDEARLRRLMPDAAFLGVLHGVELGRVYASLDVFVHTGRHETYCQSAQEALASGVPVVAPRAGGPIDVVHDWSRASSTSPATATTSAGTSTGSPRDPEFRRRMGLAARRAVEGRSWQAVNEALVEHYRDGGRDDDRLPPAGRLTQQRLIASSTLVDEVDAVLHRPAAGQGLEQRPGGHRLGPVRAADQDHRGHRGLVGVVVLAGVLEDLLDRAAGPGQEDDAGVADLEQGRLAGGVAEVLRDGRGEDVRRLVAVVPGRDARASRAGRRPPRRPRGPAAASRRPRAGTSAPRPGRPPRR